MIRRPTRRTILLSGAAVAAQPLLRLPALAQAGETGGLDAAGEAAWTHGIAMHGAPKYPAGFANLDYANPSAPKGGVLSQAVVGSFDSLNPFIVSGRAAVGVRDYLYPQLLARVWDEPFTLYAYVAESVAMPEDRRWIAFRLDPRARFDDGSPITVEDVLFTFETLREKGLPSFRTAYGNVAAVEREGERGIRFTFVEGATREAPMLMGLMPVLSRAWHESHPFGEGPLDIPLSGGPYRIAEMDPGRSIEYERVADWWAAELPALRGLYNFDRLRYSYFRDGDVALEAFRVGQVNFRREPSAETWSSGAYDVPAVADGRITLLELPQFRPEGMRGFAMNTRRPVFADPRVRRAMITAFDFEWVNQTLLGGQYRRIDSYFANSNLAARGLPDAAELALLEPFRADLPAALFTEPPSLPVSDGTGRNRANLRAAQALLAEAGWVVQEGELRDPSGNPFVFEIMLQNAEDQRVALAFVDQLARLGARATVRVVDSAQYVNRLETFDFDMIIDRRGVTLSPGTEQATYWSSRAAETPGSRNYAGVRSAAVDALVEAVADAASQEALQAAVHALDRVLLWGFYYVPLYFTDRDFFAFWGDLRRVTSVDPVYGTVIESWWQGGES